MKKLLTILFIFSALASSSQVLQEPTIYGTLYKNLGAKNAILLPTICGTPTLDSALNKYKQGAIIYDSCGHHFYVYDPSTAIWSLIQGLSGGVTDSFNLKLNAVVPPSAPTYTDLYTIGNLNGSYSYSATYVNRNGFETQSADNNTPITVSSSQVQVTVSTSTDTSVTKRRIYRTIGNPNDAVLRYLVATINDNTTTTYTDNIADGSLGAVMPRVNTTGGQMFLNSSRIGYYGSSISIGINSAPSNGGYANTFYGSNIAILPSFNGYRLTGVGFDAFQGCKTCFESSAFGVHALASDSSGSASNSFGYGNQMNSIDAIGNNSMGNFALSGNIHGSYNDVSGEEALQIGEANGNTVHGAYALQNAKNATANDVSGQQALLNDTLSNFNTVHGYNAYHTGQAISNATALGTNAAYSALSGGGVHIGNNAGYYETQGDRLYIDNYGGTSESDGRNKALMYGRFSTNVDSQFLQVNGQLTAIFTDQVPGNSATSSGIFRANAGTNQELAIGGTYNSGNRYMWMQSRHPSPLYSLYYNLSLNPLGGNVSIGKTPTSYLFDVGGAANFDGKVTYSTNPTMTDADSLALTDKKYVDSLKDSLYTAKGITTDSTLNPGHATIILDSAYMDSTVRTIDQWTSSGSNIYRNTGNVAIGDSVPANLLEVRYDGLANSKVFSKSICLVNGTDATASVLEQYPPSLFAKGASWTSSNNTMYYSITPESSLGSGDFRFAYGLNDNTTPTDADIKLRSIIASGGTNTLGAFLLNSTENKISTSGGILSLTTSSNSGFYPYVYSYNIDNKLNTRSDTLGTVNTFHRFLGGFSTGNSVGYTATEHNVFFDLEPSINYTTSGTHPINTIGSYEGMRINVTETSLPTGQNYLLRAGTGGGTFTSKFDIQNNGKVITHAPINLTAYTVATLPSGVEGDEAYCTDLTSPTFMGTAVGGGSVVGMVFYNGVNWITQ